MDLNVGEWDLCFVVNTSSPSDKDSGEQSRAHGPSCLYFFMRADNAMASLHICLV